MSQTQNGAPRLGALRLYIAALAVILAVVCSFALRAGGEPGPWWAWAVFTTLFALTEFVDLSFYSRKERVGLSAAETILLPLLVGFSLPQAVLGTVLAIAVVRILRWRNGWLKGIFNVAEYGIAAGAAAFIWHGFEGNIDSFGLREGVIGLVSIATFSILTHTFVLIALWLTERPPIMETLRTLAAPTLINLGGSIILGIILSASYISAPWTVVLFPLPLGGLFLGYRAIMTQHAERERVEQLHSASRALASKPDLSGALIGYLDAVRQVSSAAEARVVVRSQKQIVWSGVRGHEVLADLERVDDGPMSRLLGHLVENPAPLTVEQDASGAEGELRDLFGVSSLMAAPLVDDGSVLGYVVALDRAGADDFSERDERLLDALGHELVVSLDSHRLFARVSEERERFRRIFQGSKEGICLLDERGVVRAWNPALHEISGFDEAEMIGHPWSDKLVVRDWAQKRLQARELVDVRPDVELELVTKEGPTRWISVLVDEVPSGEERGWVLMVRDVTAIHTAEEAKSDFLSTISHELRTPLTTIKGSLQVLGRGVEQLPEGMAEQMIAVMRRGSDRLERLVMNLLTVSQLETGGMNVFTEELSLAQLIDNAADNVMRDHPHVAIDLDADDLTVRADRERFLHAISQLMDNAVKFGGPQGEVRISAEKRNGFACVRVSDQGPGIPAADRERVFERFVRLGSLLTRETQGAGVGLFIAKKSVEAMNGRIYIEPNDHGATFVIELPLAYPMAVADRA